MRVTTVTLNPAIDMTIRLTEPLARGAVNLAQSVGEAPGGKGINVASFLADWGVDVTVTGLLGSGNARIFDELFGEKRMLDKFVRVEGNTRTNVKIVDGNETTDVNLPGLSANYSALYSLESTLQDIVSQSEKPCIIALSGSLPRDCPTEIYARLVEKLQRAGGHVILDTSGEALVSALEAPIKPFYVKPNKSELENWYGRPIETREDLIYESRGLLVSGVKLVAISMGADGALFLSEDEVLFARKKVQRPGSTVGAGDSMVAGIIAAICEGSDLERIARLGTAFAVARVDSDFPDGPREHSSIERIASTVEIRNINP